MNGISVPMDKLNYKQIYAIKRFARAFPTKMEGYIFLAKDAGVSLSSVQKALSGKELSEQIINKIIKAL